MSGTTWDDGRLPYHLRQPPKPAKPKRGLRRVSKKTAAANRKYSKFEELYFEANPECEGGCGNVCEQFHHVCRGANRGTSLVNPNTGMGGCVECHAAWDAMPIVEQLAIKVRSIVRAVNKYLAPKDTPNPPQRITIPDLIKALEESDD